MANCAAAGAGGVIVVSGALTVVGAAAASAVVTVSTWVAATDAGVEVVDSVVEPPHAATTTRRTIDPVSFRMIGVYANSDAGFPTRPAGSSHEIIQRGVQPCVDRRGSGRCRSVAATGCCGQTLPQ